MIVIEFEETGQNFSFWTLDENNIIIDCGPLEEMVWCGFIVDRATIKVGEYPQIMGFSGERQTVQCKIKSVNFGDKIKNKVG